MRVKKGLVIDGVVVELLKELGAGYELYESSEEIEGGYGKRYYIAYNGVVMFELTAVADGDDMAHIDEFNVRLIGEEINDE